jgi:putative inorganic carbon (hco3(-)) transporter
MTLLACFLFVSGPGTTGILLYLLMIAAVPLSILWKPQIGVYVLVPFMPLQTLRYQLQLFPLGEKFVDILLLSTLIGLFLHSRDSFPPRTRLTRYVGWLALFYYISLWFGSFHLNLALPFLPSNERFADWKNYVEMPLFFLIVTASIRTKQQMKFLLALMMVSVLRANLGFYHTVSERDFSHFSYGLRYAGALGYAGENGLAAFEAQFLLFCLGLFSAVRELRLKLLIAASVLLALYCLLFSFSRGGYIGLMAGLLFLGLAKERKYLIVFCVILFSWQAFVPTAVRERIMMTYEDGQVDSSSGERVQLWEDALTIIPQNPVLGTGFDTYKLLGRSEDYTDTHNYYMKVTVETGIVGLILFLLLLWKMLRESIALLRRSHDRFFQGLGLGFGAMMVCVVTVNLFGDRWMFQQVTAYMWVALGLVCRAQLIDRQTTDAPARRLHPSSASIQLQPEALAECLA